MLLGSITILSAVAAVLCAVVVVGSAARWAVAHPIATSARRRARAIISGSALSPSNTYLAEQNTSKLKEKGKQ